MAPFTTERMLNGLRDIHGPIELPGWPIGLLLAALLISLLLIALLFLSRRRRPTPPLTTPPWEEALRELDAASHLCCPEHALAFMERASQILRRYLEGRFAIAASPRTTAEFLQAMATMATDPALPPLREQIRQSLEQADLSKFAHRVPDQNELQQVDGVIRSLIQQTRPQPAEGGER